MNMIKGATGRAKVMNSSFSFTDVKWKEPLMGKLQLPSAHR